MHNNKANGVNVRIVKHNPVSIKPWGEGAGKVCEIYRFPETASDKDYSVRFSTATIEVPESDFTLYPGYIRHHRTLRGACVFEIHASDNNTLVDQSGTVFDFSGDTQLKCKLTTASAFAINLIHHPQVNVSDRVVQVNAKNMNLDELVTSSVGMLNPCSKIFNIIYVVEGELRLDETVKDQQCSLAAGDTIIIASDSKGLDDHAWCVIDCAATIYHGVAVI
tara:strand:- start:2213 stop:2875 length:663 start_codon:yes stop_codon:yes gene_type:complete